MLVKGRNRRASKSVRKIRGRVQNCEMEVRRLSELIEKYDVDRKTLLEQVNNISKTNQRVAKLYSFLDNLVARLTFRRKK
jgi:hypothetical protein